MNTMHYKNYISRVEFDEEVGFFHGEVINCKDVITFQGGSVSELQAALKDSVEFYLAHCKKKGKAPAETMPGQFVLRFSNPQDHLKIYLAAKEEGKSISGWAREQLLRIATHKVSLA